MSLRPYLLRQDLLFALLLVASALGHWGLGYVGGATVQRPVPLQRQHGRTTVAIELVAPAQSAVAEALPALPPWEQQEVLQEPPLLEIPLVSIRQDLFTTRQSTRETERSRQRRDLEPIPESEPESEPLVQRVPRQQPPSPRLESPPSRQLPPKPQKRVPLESQVRIEEVPVEATQTVISKGSTGVPVPPQIRSRPDPVHPRELLRRKIQGTVKLTVRVAADGMVRDVKVNQSSGYRTMDQAAVEAVQRWQFAAGRRNGRAVGMTVIVPVEFRIVRR